MWQGEGRGNIEELERLCDKAAEVAGKLSILYTKEVIKRRREENVKIMNVKMVVDEEGNEVKASEALGALHKMLEKDYNYFDYTNGLEPSLEDVFDMLEKAKAVKIVKPSVMTALATPYDVRKGERFGEVYAWLREMLEEGAGDEENFGR